MEAQSTGSAWPDPPYLYKRYTKDNVDRLNEARKTGEFPEEVIHQPPLEDFDLRDLEPPTPPTDAYTVFDQQWQVKEHLPTLSDLNVKQIFPEGPIDRVQELKKLNRSLIVEFLDLLDALVRNPDQYGDRIENISTIFINMHHILNEYRPHQANGDARETLRLLMENQIARKRQLAAEMRRKCKETREALQAFGRETTAPLALDMKAREQVGLADRPSPPTADEDVDMKPALEDTQHVLPVMAAVDAIE
ncbi:MED7 protein-domain-containing protein [Syncephalastrum racemosum]|uniref:Mediator of RNA polymerase II transcription subunit 7 n=1 Tax=Syncephalastrum racemosum TaxID=13706 RepID=A0A1X2H7A8_SYNRA|nr:MED7 protein-domain-containing protein [Syncephalastrum racemosum]